jgi:hypothetical protein
LRVKYAGLGMLAPGLSNLTLRSPVRRP